MPHGDFPMAGPEPVLRALKSELVDRDGLAWLNDAPFSGLVFDTGSLDEAVQITFHGAGVSCQRIRGVESYNDGRHGGEFALLDVELPFMHTPLTSGELPEQAEHYDAKLDDGAGFSGALYVPSAKDGWAATLYTAGIAKAELWWYPDGRLARAHSFITITEEFSWYKDGTAKRCLIESSPDTRLCIAFAPDHHVTLLIVENWKAAVSYPGRSLNFQCIDKFDDVLKLHSDKEISLWVGNDFINSLAEIRESRFLDDVETIKWNGAVFGDPVFDLFEGLSKKKLRTVLFQSYHERSMAFAVTLAERLPELKVVSWALNKAKRGE